MMQSYSSAPQRIGKTTKGEKLKPLTAKSNPPDLGKAGKGTSRTVHRAFRRRLSGG